MFWKNCVAFLQNSSETCRNYAKQQWSCSGGMLCIMQLTLTDRERRVQLSNSVNPAVFVTLSLTLAVFRSLCLLPSVFLVTDGRCKQLCVTGLVAWFLLEWLCNSNPIAPRLASPLPSPAPPSVSFCITIYVEHRLLPASFSLGEHTLCIEVLNFDTAETRSNLNLLCEPLRKLENEQGKTTDVSGVQ